MLAVNPDFWYGKRVLITGHTGFKGGWLSLWLHSMGAEVHGYALAPSSNPNFFSVGRIGDIVSSNTFADICDHAALLAAIRSIRPEVVFHLAAQALVRLGYQRPVETYRTNILGTVHLLEALRITDAVKAVVNITSDKCYENRSEHVGYREDARIGGHDPYSSSKACSELITAAYRDSFLRDLGIAVATARAGNVIGGGDWAVDRLIPDVLRALDAGTALNVRAPQAIRPWQHVLEPLSGYLMLAERLHAQESESSCAEPWNFGPADDGAQSVDWILHHLASRMPKITWRVDTSLQPHEASHLKLDSSKARARLGWHPRWHLKIALDKTLDWHQAWRSGQDMQILTLAQIDQYLNNVEAVANHGTF